jgi:hypothetical protein
VGIRPFLIVRADRDGGIVDPPPETANANGGPEVIRDLRSLVDRF